MLSLKNIGGDKLIIETIRRLCAEKGVSIARVEKETGLGNGVVARWASSAPRVNNLKAVADYFGVTVDELLSDTTDTTTRNPTGKE